MSLTIREANDADRDVLVEQFHLLNKFEDTINHSLLTDRATAEATAIEAGDYIASNGGNRLLAEIDDQVVGFLYMVVRDDDPYVREELRRLAHVSDLFVLEEFRGRGIARALVAEAERIGRERGAKCMTIGVMVGNDNAERAYKNFGFTPYHTRLSKTLR